METEQIKELIRQELPMILQNDESFRQYILRLAQQKFADRQETESRFDRVLNQLERDREEQSRQRDKDRAEDARKWDENVRKWAENDRKWHEANRQYEQNRAEDARKWAEAKAEDARKWAEDARKWAEAKAEDARKWDEAKAEDARKWAEAKAEDARKWEAWYVEWAAARREDERRFKRSETQLTAIGARWGMRSEKSFRHALKGLLEEYFQVQVQNVIERDELGEVYGRPDEIELDIIIKNGLLIICELKSSMSYNDMSIFERKIRFYEKKHQRTATRSIVISPMVSPSAKNLADTLNIEIFSYADDVGELL